MSPELPNDPAAWRAIEAIFHAALELPAGDRSPFLDQACAGDPVLRREVEAMLVADAAASDFLAGAVEVSPELLADTATTNGATPELVTRDVGPYRLVREIGRGGMGVVFEAVDPRLGRRVAIKFLPSEYGSDPAAKERFLREARAASALDHPNVCVVHDVGTFEGRLYIVMPLYQGETLKERLLRGPLPIGEAQTVAIQVARGLLRAHEATIVHRDVKPANVIVTRLGEAKILDFGIAKMKSEVSLTGTGRSPGTLAYMSPEQALGKPVDGRTDLWSLGVLLHEMVAGSHPFAGPDEQAVVCAILGREAEPLDRLRPEVPAALARVVRKALAKDPAERYQSAGEMLAELEAAAVAVPPRGGRRWNRASPAATRGLMAAGLMMIVLAVWWMSHRLLRPPVVRVAIAKPVVTTGDSNPDFAFSAAEVMGSTLSTLAMLESVQPLDPPDRDERDDSSAQRRRAQEADETLRASLGCQADGCQVRLRRLSPTGTVLEAIGPFEVPTGLEQARALDEAVRIHVQRLYGRYSPRRGVPAAQVTARDYAAFAQLVRRTERGELLGAEGLARLDTLLRTSPDLLSAWLLAAGTARRLPDLDRAMAYAQRAHRLAPLDPRPLFERFRIEIADRRLTAAQSTLNHLAELSPGDVRVQISRAELLEANGELRRALPVRQEVARRRPTWRNVLALANLETRLGESASARRRLRELLRDESKNQYVLETLAALEIQFGEPSEAARLYEERIAIAPARPAHTGLGFARYLLGDYAGAVDANRRALALEPGHLLTSFNLAAALEARGDRAEARAFYVSWLRDLAATPGEPDDRIRLLQAQCLARLGRREEALRAAERALKRAPDDVQVLHQAAQLHALVGERLSALFYTERARKKGLHREWFTIPEFRSLAADPEFRLLVDGPAPRPS